MNEHAVFDGTTVSEEGDGYDIRFNTTVDIEDESIIFDVGEELHSQLSMLLDDYINRDDFWRELSVTHQSEGDGLTYHIEVVRR